MFVYLRGVIQAPSGCTCHDQLWRALNFVAGSDNEVVVIFSVCNTCSCCLLRLKPGRGLWEPKSPIGIFQKRLSVLILLDGIRGALV